MLATATADNQLADKDFVNSSIATATAEFKGSFTSLDELKATSGNLNDYAFYLHNDSVGNSIVDRYKWTTAGWLYEYTLNNSSFTAEQWAALNSAITATLVQSYNSHLDNTTIHITSAERNAWNNKWDYNEEIIKAVKVNAAVLSDSATKLANSYTIFGRPFNGTAKVSEVVSDIRRVIIGADLGDWDGNRAELELITAIDNPNDFWLGTNSQRDWCLSARSSADGNALHLYNRNMDRVATLNQNGNILIGTITDNGYKLQVNGSERVYGDLIVDGEVSALVA